MNLSEQGYSFTATAEREIVRDVKAKLCHVGVDYDTELKSTAEIDKDKTETSLSALNVSIALKCYSSQVFTGKKSSGFHDTSSQSNMKCDVYIRKESFANAVLSSGTDVFQEIIERMTKEHMVLFHQR